jgi:hypothetical protein
LPSHTCIVAGAGQRRLQGSETALVAKFRPGSPQQRTQRRVPQRRLVEFGEVLVVTPVAEEQRIAQIVQRPSILGHGPERGAGEILEHSWILFPRDSVTRPLSPIVSAQGRLYEQQLIEKRYE